MARYDDELSYSKQHVWVRDEGDLLTLGITDYAQESLGEIISVDLPTEGEEVGKDEIFGSVESFDSVTDLYAPVSGEVVEVNPLVVEKPELLNIDPYGDGWLIKVRPYDLDEIEGLADADEYREYVEGELEH